MTVPGRFGLTGQDGLCRLAGPGSAAAFVEASSHVDMMSCVSAAAASTLLDSLGTSAFGSTFMEVFGAAIGIDTCTAFAFPTVGSAVSVMAEASTLDASRATRRLAESFTRGAFCHDPNVRKLLRGGEAVSGPDIYGFDPAEIDDASYRREFYDDPRIIAELVVLDRRGTMPIYTSFYRTASHPPISSQDMALAAPFLIFAASALRKHVALLHGQPQSRPDAEGMFENVRRALLSLRCQITPREAEICAGIVLGYTTLGISLNLGITANTVATHRKRAYAKLGISSQNELFARYFDALGRRARSDGGLTVPG